MSGSTLQDIILGVIMVIAFIPAIVLHECAHGYAAYKLGDTTAKDAGRLTLNPVKHADLWGTVLIPGLLILSSVASGGGGMVFGYAKPVPYNPRRFKNIRRGEVIVAFAGPVSNLAMAIVGALIAHGADWLLLAAAASGQAALTTAVVYIWYFGAYFCMVNLSLAFFNLIPLPPLDGSAIIAPLLSDRALARYYQIQRYAMFLLLLVILVIPYLTGFDIIGIYLRYTAGNLFNLLVG